MPTEKQIAAQLKKERNEIKRGIVARVTTAALHIIHDSQLKGTRLWPKDDVLAFSAYIFDYDDIIAVQTLVTYNEEGIFKEYLRISLLNKNYTRINKQRDQIELILDQATKEDVYFEYIDYGEIGQGLYNTWITMTFKFKINN